MINKGAAAKICRVSARHDFHEERKTEEAPTCSLTRVQEDLMECIELIRILRARDPARARANDVIIAVRAYISTALKMHDVIMDCA